MRTSLGRRPIHKSDYAQRSLLGVELERGKACLFLEQSEDPLQNTVVQQLRIIVQNADELVKSWLSTLFRYIFSVNIYFFPSTRAPAMNKMFCYG